MNRRKFLMMLGLAPVVASNASLLSSLLPESDADYYRRKRAQIPIEKRNDLIGGWVSYKFKYTVSLPPQRTLRRELPFTQIIDGHNIVHRTYVRGQQAKIA